MILLDTFQGQVLFLDQDLSRIVHDVLGKGDDLVVDGSGEKTDLAIWRNHLDDLIDLLKESKSEHLISLIDDEHL